MSTIVLTGGGTAGHVTPHLVLIPRLEKIFDKVAYLGSNGVEKELISRFNEVDYFTINSVKLVRGKILSNLFLPFKLLKAKSQALKILKTIKPSVIFSKGGYVSVPVVLAAKKLKIPVICHESDLSVGLANKIGARTAKVVFTTFKKTAQTIGEKAKFSGSPIDEAAFKTSPALIKEKLKIKTDLPILLITGGSLGSQVINNSIFEALDELTQNFYVIHVVGKNNVKKIANKNYLQIEFAKNMPELIKISDVVVSRAGSNTIFELAFCLKPMLLIPLPKGASRGDQVENAEYFASHKIANVLYQENLDKNSLINEINKTFKNQQQLVNNLKKINFKNGADAIIEELKKYK